MLRGAFYVAALLAAAIAAVMLAQEPGTVRARGFVATFLDSAWKGTDLHRETVAAGSAREVERAREWMSAEPPQLRCEALGFRPRSSLHECMVHFASGATAHVDVAEEDGRMRVVYFSCAPPGGAAR